LNAAWRAALLAPPAPAPPAEGGRVGAVPEPPPPPRAGGVMPWLFKHCTNAVRLALEPPAEADADVDVVPELLAALLPHAAIARLAVTAPSTGITRSARRRFLMGEFMLVLSWWC
jgi:hypothetical protein